MLILSKYRGKYEFLENSARAAPNLLNIKVSYITREGGYILAESSVSVHTTIVVFLVTPG